MDDSYLTIKRESKIDTKVKGSRFIGETFKVANVAEALEKLDEVRKREYNATHHCYAYITGLGREQVFKYSDDGEPSGTAGRPIYDIIAGADVTSILCVVTRYFGGTKLGTGGLVRAYGETAREALKASEPRT
ncbi:MAG: YigZ family protein, partial [bacterium]|nr:YigZ family protein [bacterium]